MARKTTLQREAERVLGTGAYVGVDWERLKVPNAWAREHDGKRVVMVAGHRSATVCRRALLTCLRALPSAKRKARP